ncbi:unnamed protein product, partial [Sphacelaria rigidula]
VQSFRKLSSVCRLCCSDVGPTTGVMMIPGCGCGFLCNPHTLPDSFCEFCKPPIPLPDSSVGFVRKLYPNPRGGHAPKELLERRYRFSVQASQTVPDKSCNFCKTVIPVPDISVSSVRNIIPYRTYPYLTEH